MAQNFSFSDQELDLLNDQAFLLTKQKLDLKMEQWLIDYQKALLPFFESQQHKIPQVNNWLPNKINKGQNYNGLPYWVVDFPSVFKGQHFFTFRTVVWWGNFISCNFIAQGSFFQTIQFEPLQLLNSSVFFCVSPTPWRLEFEPNNLIAVNSENMDAIKHHMSNAEFLKLSTRIELNDIKNLPDLGQESFETILSACDWRNI